MNKLTSLSLLLSFSLALVSCAHQGRAPEVVLTEEQVERLNREALELAAERLDALAEESQRQGPASSQYLATGLFLKGNSALMSGDFATALVLLKPLTKLTADPFVHKKYAVALIRTGQMEAAQKVLESIYAKNKDEGAGLILAGVYGSAERGSDAQRVYREILARNPQQEEACLFLAKAIGFERKWAEAEKQYKLCQARHAGNAVFSFYLGKMHVERNDLKSAQLAFREAHRQDPKSGQAVAALGVIFEQLERSDEAVALYKKYLALRPHDTSILSRLVQALFLKERFDEVIPYAERLVDLEPEDLNLRVKLGILYTDAKHYDKAISVFHELLQQVPGSDKILYYLGAIHQELSKFELAIDYFTRIPTSSGLYQDSSFQVANMLGALAQVEHSAGVKDGASAQRFLAHVSSKLQEFPELKVELRVLEAGFFEATERDTQAVASLKSVAHEKSFGVQHQYYLAGLLEKVKDYEAATALIMGILEKDPKNAHAWNFIGYSLLERGHSPEEALPYIEKALALSPDDGYIRDSLGWYYFKTGRLKEALAELNFAFEKVPDDVVIAKHLALIHKDMKNFSKARSYLQHALKNARMRSEQREIASVLELLEGDRTPASVVKDDH